MGGGGVVNEAKLSFLGRFQTSDISRSKTPLACPQTTRQDAVQGSSAVTGSITRRPLAAAFCCLIDPFAVTLLDLLDRINVCLYRFGELKKKKRFQHEVGIQAGHI